MKASALNGIQRLLFQPPRVEHRLGIAGGLFAAEGKIAGGLKSHGSVKVRRHRNIGAVALVLPVNYLGHFLRAFITVASSHTS